MALRDFIDLDLSDLLQLIFQPRLASLLQLVSRALLRRSAPFERQPYDLVETEDY